MPVLLVVLFIVVPIVELYVLIQVGQLIGVLPTVALLVVDSLLGAALVRREGRRTWVAFRDATAQGRVPAREVADGALVVFGGALLLTPGFTTDVVGLLCVLPPTRAVLRRAFTGLALRRLGMGGAAGRVAGGPGAGPLGPRGQRRSARRRHATTSPSGPRHGSWRGGGRTPPPAGPAPPPAPARGGVVEGEVVGEVVEDP